MSYSLLKNAFPMIERLEDVTTTPPPAPQTNRPSSIDSIPEFSSISVPKPTSTQVQETLAPQNQSKHLECVGHIIECLQCRDYLMSRMSFYDKNREIADAIPYIILIIFLVLLFKRL